MSSTEWPAARIRSAFIGFFKDKKDHVFWPSSPVVPVNDPTLLFANAGMNQFKPLFLGTCDPSLEMAKLKMVVNSQKCIRAGGKHNDLEDVGKDVYHHTFFEMLGNWSFGSYFKEEAISMAWECLTVEFGIDPARLYATYFEGDDSQGLAPDVEARNIWLRYLPSERIIGCGCKDNFWEMGATGPCGPCTEIHYDRIGGRDAALLVNADRPDVIEIWNNVFIQFNREADGSLKELPSKHVDTGMGFERLASILQGKDSNYDTDIFMPIFAAIQSICGCRAYSGLLGAEDVGLVDMAYRVLADHIRTLTFAITDGAVPSSDGRGYVLRRILRRAIRYGQEMLGAPSGFFAKLVPTVVQNFSDAFPELLTRKDYVTMVIAEEEASFNRTLDDGVKHFKKVVATMQASGSTVVPAKDTHILFTSMGFPLDLTELMAAERGLTVDTEGFKALMENDRNISKADTQAKKGGGSKDLTMAAEQTSHLQVAGVSPTESDLKYQWNNVPTATIKALYVGRGGSTAGFVDSVTAEDGVVGVVLDLTSFYYESGGQTFDTGFLAKLADGSKFVVTNAQTYAGYVVHVGAVEGADADLKVGDQVELHVDYDRRGFVAPNHTMTHVLNFALRQVLLGAKAADASNSMTQGLCEQKGSLVDLEKLRFDFSWTSALTSEQLMKVESIVNEQIKKSLPVYSQNVPFADAAQICSLRKVFGERYPDPVRVVSVGKDITDLVTNPDNSEWYSYSVEFCGGTHLTNTQQAEDFVIVEESGIAKGIRRITGMTRSRAAAARKEAAALIKRLDDALLVTVGGPELIAEFKLLKVEVDQAFVSLVDKDVMRSKLAQVYEVVKTFLKSAEAAKLAAATTSAEEVAKIALEKQQSVVVAQIEFGADGKVVRKIHDKLKSIHSEASYFIASFDDEGEKIGMFPIVAAKHLEGNLLNAKEWVEYCITSTALGGKGGGKADQALGTIPSGSPAAMEAVLVHAQAYADARLH
mmetsp:Transcript_21570/g.29691  ORF Transcript_21570/g.29691 Transcript_21570/m.29691 type:complete len:985 (+) Transcript_21570:57-3011(+)